MKPIYLDNAATTPMHTAVVATMFEAMKEDFGNPSSVHQFGRKAHGKLEVARSQIAKSIGAKETEIFFTSGGTEGDNYAIMQTAFLRKEFGKHLITTAVEHHAVLHTMEFLETQGFEVTYLSVDDTGQIDLDELKAALRPDTILVSIMFANNEIGTIYPINEIGAILSEHQAYFHTDAVQAYGCLDIDVKELNVNFLSVSAHKISGPKGVGFLYMKEATPLPPLMHGGDQETKKRAGTENLPGIIGFSQAVRLLSSDQKEKNALHYEELRTQLLNALAAENIEFEVNGDASQRLPHILNLWIKGIPNDLLLVHLDLMGIAISTGSACTAGNVEPSHVLSAMYGTKNPLIKESIRISFGKQTTSDEITYLASCLNKIVHKIKK